MNNKINGRTPEEIKKGLERCPSDANCSLCLSGFHCDLEADALAYIQQLESTQPKWISVEERLPEHGEVVMVWAKAKPDEEALPRDILSFASYWCDDGWVVDFIDDTDDITVTHWMPLPEAPKEEV